MSKIQDLIDSFRIGMPSRARNDKRDAVTVVVSRSVMEEHFDGNMDLYQDPVSVFGFRVTEVPDGDPRAGSVEIIEGRRKMIWRPNSTPGPLDSETTYLATIPVVVQYGSRPSSMVGQKFAVMVGWDGRVLAWSSDISKAQSLTPKECEKLKKRYEKLICEHGQISLVAEGKVAEAKAEEGKVAE